MKSIRILLVEDDPAMMEWLTACYQETFQTRGFSADLSYATNVEEARRLAKSAGRLPYDLVSLDLNLGDTQLTGLNVLDTLNRCQSAWMVAMLTGIETDSTLDKTMGESRGNDLRKQFRRDAYSRFPAERLIVVEKPAAATERSKAATLLTSRIEQIALVYEEVSRLRYIFRAIEVASLERVTQTKGQKRKRTFVETTAVHWQIRFDCGEIRTLPNLAGFKTLHYLLSRDRNGSVTPEEALAIEPKSQRTPARPEQCEDPVAAYFEAQGIGWKELSADEQSKLVRAALSLKFNRYCELRAFEDEGDLTTAEESELARIVRELGPLQTAAETAYHRMKPSESASEEGVSLSLGVIAQSDLHVAGGNYDQLGEDRRGKDSPAAQLFRARMKRVKDCLRENGFAEFARHIEDYLQSSGANWSYNPPENIDWTT